MAEAALLKALANPQVDIWLHFRFKRNKDGDDLDKAQCKMCKTEVKYCVKFDETSLSYLVCRGIFLRISHKVFTLKITETVATFM